MGIAKRIGTLLCTAALVLTMCLPVARTAYDMRGAESSDEKTSEDFYQKLVELISNQSEESGDMPTDDSDPYGSARLMVFADGDLDTEMLDADTCLYDGSGMWVIQFESSEAAEAAAKRLASAGIESQPDALADRAESIEEGDFVYALASSHYSWGVADAHFDSFLSKHVSKFTGSGVVAVVDSGVDASHPFLRGKVLQGYDFVDDDTDATDEYYHGTLIASVIVDCVGDAPVKILPLRVLDKNGTGYTSLSSAAIKYAVDHGADVINYSLGGDHSQAREEAIQYAIDRGVIVIIAAGNESDDAAHYCPSDMTVPGAVIVGSCNSNHKKAQTSNYGKTVDMLAPGVGVRAAVPGGSFKTMGGTSLAVPHVSAAAMLLDLVWGKSLTPGELEGKLYTATSSGGKRIDNYYGYGLLDMTKASVPTNAAPDPVPSPTPSPVPAQPSLHSVSVKPGVYHIEAYCGKIVEVEDSRTENRANVQLWALSKSDLKCQRFDIQPSGNGYVLKAVHSKKAIDVADGATTSGTNVWQWGLNQTPAQTWTFEDAGDGYVYIKSGLETYLTVKGGGAENGTNVISCTFDGGSAQKFKLVSYGAADTERHGETVSVTAGTYYIEANCGKIVEVADSKMADGANVQLWVLSSRNLECQKWQIATSNGGYVVKATHSGKALDVADGSAKSGTNIW